MSDIDKLRGTPQGHTATSSISSKELKNAALTTAAVLTMAAAPTNLQAQQIEQEPVNDAHKIEVVSSQTTNTDDENVIDFETVAQVETQKENSEKLKLEDIKKIEYNAQDKYFNIECHDGSQIVIDEASLEQRKIEKEAKQEHKEQFSSPVTIEREVLDRQGILDQIHDYNDVLAGAYDSTTNTITMYDYEDNATYNDSENTKALLAKIGVFLNDENFDKQTEVHEMSHAEDFNNREFAIDVNQTQGQIHRKNYDTEIKANIAEAAYGLEKFKQTGNIDDIASLNSGDLKEFKEWLQENPDKVDSKECKLRLAKAVHDGWLEKNNVEGSSYYTQAQRAVEDRDITYEGDFTAYADGSISAGAIVENSGNINDYLKAQESIFKDTALGDVSSVCCGYVELGAGAKMTDVNKDISPAQTQAEELIQTITQNATTTRQAARKIENVLDVVKKADKDGERTEKEQAKIDKVLNNVINGSSKQFDQKRKDAITIAQKTGRARESGVMKKQDAGKTIVKENANTSESILAMKNSNIGRG